MENESHFKTLILSEVIPILKEKEQALLESSRQYPTNSQKEISEQVGISRLSVTDMTLEFNRCDYTLAKENTINNDMPVICIGGMNVDRKFYAKKELIMRTSNPVSSSVSIGGVGRNIAENLGRLGENVVMLSRVGDDQDWYLIKSTSESYMDLQHVEVCQAQETSTYIAIIDSDGDMSMALANMAICDSMTVSWLERYESLLSRSKALVVDLNLPQESLFYLIQLARKENLGLAIIPVSVPKMFNLPKNLTGVDWLIVNQNESEFFFDKPLDSGGDIEDLAKLWLETGLKQVLITRGAESMLYANHNGQRHFMTPKFIPQVIDTTGAGDSLSAGVLFGWLNYFDIQETLEFGLTNSYYTIQSQDTVRKNLSRYSFLQERRELFTHKS